MATRQTEKQKRTGKKTRTNRGKRAVEDMGSRPGCGVVGCHGWRVDGVELSMLASESSEGGYSVEFPCGTVAEGRDLFTSRERDRQEDREWGKVWTMTQGHEPHGDGEGREELLIRACGISYGYHRTDSVLPSWLLLSRHQSLRHQLNTRQRFFYQPRTEGRWGGIRVSLRSNSQGMSFLDSVIKARSLPLWCNLTRHKAQIMINELFTKAEPTPVALSHTNFPQMSQLSSDWRAYVGNTASLSTKGIWISAVAIMTLLITTFCTLKGRSGYPRTRLLTELAFDLTRRSSYGRNIVRDQTDSGVKSRMRSMIDVKYWGILKRKIYFINYRLVFGF